MRKHSYPGSRMYRFTHGVMACCIMLLLACSGQAQKQVSQSKSANWIDWKVDYKGQMNKEEKAKLYDNITSYAKDWLVSQKKADLAKDLKLSFTESGNSIRVICDGSSFNKPTQTKSAGAVNNGSAVATGSIVIGPHPPPPPIIPSDKLKAMSPKAIAIAGMH